MRLEQLEKRELLSLTHPAEFVGLSPEPELCEVSSGALVESTVSPKSDSIPLVLLNDEAQATVAAPSDVTFGYYDATTRQVDVSWTDNSDDETGFRVEYSTDGGNTWSLSQELSANVVFATISGVKPNAEYVFRVCALRDGEKSDWAYSDSLQTKAYVESPSDLTIGEYNLQARSLTMSWTDNANAETGFYLEQSTDGGRTWSYSTTVAPNVTTLTAWNVKPGKTYVFRLCALDGNKKIGWAYSDPIVPGAPNAPSDLTLGQYDSKTEKVALSWTDNSDDETGFRVEYSVDGGATWRLSENMDADVTERTAWKVHKNMKYVFRVCAFRNNLQSTWTYSEVLDTNQPLLPPSDVILGLYDADTETLPMSWTDNSDDETGFRVEYTIDGGKTWLLSEKMEANVAKRTAVFVHLGKTYQFRVCALRGELRSEWTYSEAFVPSKKVD